MGLSVTGGLEVSIIGKRLMLGIEVEYYSGVGGVGGQALFKEDFVFPFFEEERVQFVPVATGLASCG